MRAVNADSWRCGAAAFPPGRVLLMGVLNVTPDSFSDGGRFLDPGAALAQARRLVQEGADILDIGGESTRPGAGPVPAGVQCARVLPLLEALQGCGAALSVDTSEPEVMRAAVSRGAAIINDVRAFAREGAVEAVAGSDCGLVVMHMQGEPGTMQQAPVYGDVVAEVAAWLGGRCALLAGAGIDPARIAIDPGFGFGKTQAHNLALLAGLARLRALGRPILAGLSRKATLGAITGRPVGERLAASVTAALLAAQAGAAILRVHDVAATRDALAVWNAVRAAT
jgi:dihydropteroate synthase